MKLTFSIIFCFMMQQYFKQSIFSQSTFMLINNKFSQIINFHYLMDQKTILILVTLLIVFGAINTIQLKLQNIHILNQETGQKFFHPFTQTILLFIGQSCVGFFYLYHCYRQKKIAAQKIENQPFLDKDQENRVKPNAPFMKAFWPGVFDLMATLFSYLALNTVDSSVWQMSKGGVIVTTAILSRIFLKRIFTRRAIIGCTFAFIGITSVQVVAVLSANTQTNVTATGQLIGLGLLFISILFNSFGLIIEKKIFDNYQMHPLKMVYAQGIIGVVLMSLLTFGFQFIPCPWLNKTQCVCVSENACYLQNYSKYFTDLAESNMLIYLTAGFICTIAISVPIGAFLSKEVSPISRSLANVSRTLLIWVFNIIMTNTLGQTHKQYNLQSKSVTVNCLKGLGFALLMFGTFLYHQKKKVPKEQSKEQERSEKKQTTFEMKEDLETIKYEEESSNKAVSEPDTNIDSLQTKDQLSENNSPLTIN